MNPLTLVHSSPGGNREGIEVAGLLARRPADFNWPEHPEQVIGVYAHGIGERCWEGKSGGDVWEIDALGLPLTRDPELPAEDSFIIADDVPRERLKLRT